MLRLNGSFYYSNEYYLHKSDNINSSGALILPIIGGIIYDFSSLRISYFYFFLILILIGLINNIFSFMTFIREHIRYTISGVYLIQWRSQPWAIGQLPNSLKVIAQQLLKATSIAQC
jgi:hypothetical protein